MVYAKKEFKSLFACIASKSRLGMNSYVPADAHAPLGGSDRLLKVVIKIKVAGGGTGQRARS